jgi:PAS domain S-box-containing protein
VVLLDRLGRVQTLNGTARALQPAGIEPLEVGQAFFQRVPALLSPDAAAARRLRRGFCLVCARRRPQVRTWFAPIAARRWDWLLVTLRPSDAAGEAGVLVHLATPPSAHELGRLLHESDQRYRSLVENSGDIIFVTDLSSRMLYANPALEQQTGYSAADFQMRQGDNRFIHPEDAPRVASFIAAFLAGPSRHSAPVENRFIAKDGRVLWYSSVISKCTYAGRAAMQFVVHNITELRRAQEERDALILKARDAVAARDVFLSVASHELKTPLTSLMISVQSLLRRRERGESADLASLGRPLDTIGRQGQKLAALINQLLDLSRIDAGKLLLQRKRIDLAALVREICQGARRAIHLRSPDRLTAEVDPLRFEQLLTNLIDNAIKYSDETAHIDVALEQVASGAITLAVTDRGVGIPAEQLEHVFERFYQVPSRCDRGGLGLGLYITRQIAELHGGTITAESPLEGGTRVRVTLPPPQAAG